ncbi:MAG: hypothetical protein LBD94_02010 [Rickettsiales bacterium]|jgi:hypothetical protein|nr:hypothetical protein [Rickettsiales bacterium]
MDKTRKKEILANASDVIKQKKTNWFDRAGCWIGRQARAFWKWLRGRDRLVFFNILLLALVCAMLFVMFGNAKKQKTSGARAQVRQTQQVLRPRSKPQVFNMSRPTVVVYRNGVPMSAAKHAARRPKQKTITLPLRREVPIVKKSVAGGIIIDGMRRSARLAPMTTVNGSLILQNMRSYTLPCGTKINGDLFLRNVALLKFCGCFEVRGDIYVSRDSSFGPIPKDAYLGGQVIF